MISRKIALLSREKLLIVGSENTNEVYRRNF